MNLISSAVAAERKGVSRQAIIDAIGRGEIEGHKVSPRSLVVVSNRKFEAWHPNAIRQAAGLSRAKVAARSRKRRNG